MENNVVVGSVKVHLKDEISDVLSTNRLKGTNVKVISPHLESYIA